MSAQALINAALDATVVLMLLTLVAGLGGSLSVRQISRAAHSTARETMSAVRIEPAS